MSESLPQFWIRIFGKQRALLKSEPQGSTAYAHLPVSFESLVSRLEQFDRLFIELDGSFVWTGEESEISPLPETTGSIVPVSTAWQVDGMIYDDGHAVRYVELKGTCSRQRWQDFVACMDALVDDLCIELVPEGRVVNGRDFTSRRWP